MTVFFHANGSKPGAQDVCGRLVSHARERGLDIAADGGNADAVIVLGGDGTMLEAVHRFPGTPLLGLNLGSLGYLAAVSEDRFSAAINALAENRFSVSRRTALSVRGMDALNDVVVSRGVSGGAGRFDFSVDGRRVTRFVADGLVVATPTGSTAYSLAAGGPVVLPDTHSFVVTPVCPHALSSRPLVLPDTAEISVGADTRDPGVESVVFADGRFVCRLAPGEAVEISKSSSTVPLIEIDDVNSYETLTKKLGWAAGRAETAPNGSRA